MEYNVIAAKDVKVGDYIHNTHAFHPSARWVRVVSTDTEGEHTKIKTIAFDTWLHPREGVMVRRQSV